MTKICRCTSNANFSMSLLQSSLLLFGIALFLLGGEVQCDIVGLGKHTVDISKGIVNKVNGNFELIMPNGNLTALKALPDACDDVTFEGERIKVGYKKNSKAAKEGCALDLLVTTNSSDKFTLDIGVSYSEKLSKCLVVSNFSNENLLPFTYSLNEGEFEDLRKNGPKKGNNESCQDPDGCMKRHYGNCMEVADFMVGFTHENFGYIKNYIKQIDEPAGWVCEANKGSFFITDSFFQLDITIEDKTKWTTRKEDHSKCSSDGGLEMDDWRVVCYMLDKTKNTLRKVRRWKIVDNKFDTMKNYTHLITFYMLPQKSAHKQKFNNKVWYDVQKDKLDGPNCDMYVRFPNSYRLLGPTSAPKPELVTSMHATTTTTTYKTSKTSTSKTKISSVGSTSKTKISSIGSTSRIESSSIEATIEYSSTKTSRKRTKSTRRPKTTNESKTEDSGISIVAIILIIAGIIILILLVIGILIWFFVFRGKNEENPKEINSTQQTNSGSPISKDDNEVQTNPLEIAKEEDHPLTVIQTQVDRFSDADTVVGTQMALEDSRIIGGVDVPETIKLDEE